MINFEKISETQENYKNFMSSYYDKINSLETTIKQTKNTTAKTAAENEHKTLNDAKKLMEKTFIKNAEQIISHVFTNPNKSTKLSIHHDYYSNEDNNLVLTRFEGELGQLIETISNIELGFQFFCEYENEDEIKEIKNLNNTSTVETFMNIFIKYFDTMDRMKEHLLLNNPKPKTHLKS